MREALKYKGPETQTPLGKVLAYDPDFDTRAYLKLQELPNAEVKKNLDRYTMRQVVTHVGERLHVVISKTRYNIENETLYSEDTHEPIIEMFRRGRDYRKIHGKPVDHQREEAEVEGFEEIQRIMTDEKSEVGTMMLSISPPGGEESSYDHNFYDVHALKEKNGKRFVETRRYASDLDISDYINRAREIFPNFPIPLKNPDAFFLSHPIFVEPKNSIVKTPDDIHALLHKSHSYMSEKDFMYVVEKIAPFVNLYIKVLSENPENLMLRNLTLNAVLNKADETTDEIKTLPAAKIINFEDFQSLPSRVELMRLGQKQVKVVGTGCGKSGGFDTEDGTSDGAFSVKDFGQASDEYGSRFFKCPECGLTNIRPKGELLSNCQHCNSSSVGCEEGPTSE